jgi:hypothetical protein
MADIFMTIRVKAADQAAAQNTAATVEGGAGMFAAGYTTDPTGAYPVTDYISSGWIPEEIQSLMWPSSATISYVPADQVQQQLADWGLHPMFVGD